MIKLQKTAGLALTIGLLLTTSGCGDDKEGPAETTYTTAPSKDSGSATKTEPAMDEDEAEATDCEADANSDNLSGSNSVLFSADVTTGQTEADITEETTVTISADGKSMEPKDFKVPVDTMFGLKIDTAGQLGQIEVGCADGQIAPVGIVVGFLITEPGAYKVRLDMAGTEVGTITVE